MNEIEVLSALVPVIVLLAFGVASTLASRLLRLSPIVGYIVLGLALRIMGAQAWLNSDLIQLLAQVGVALMLFDIGLHFSLEHLRAHAFDIFAFGPTQVFSCTLLLGFAGIGLDLAPAAGALDRTSGNINRQPCTRTPAIFWR
jgi:CPA2 family monovalent cation:H+ antiporter-2